MEPGSFQSGKTVVAICARCLAKPSKMVVIGHQACQDEMGECDGHVDPGSLAEKVTEMHRALPHVCLQQDAAGRSRTQQRRFGDRPVPGGVQRLGHRAMGTQWGFGVARPRLTVARSACPFVSSRLHPHTRHDEA